MATGGMLGFSSAVLVGLLDETSAWPGILWRASVAALIAGLLFRWLGTVWTGCVQQLHQERLAALNDAAHPKKTITAGKE
jgi:hypothetical protein